MTKQIDTLPQDLMLNVLPLHFEPGTVKISFFKEKPEHSEMVSLEGHHIPLRLEGYERLYTDFKEHSEADMSVQIPFGKSKNFAGHYLKHLLYTWFEGKADIRNRNFIRDVELYFEQDKSETPKFRSYHRFTLKAFYQRFTDGFEIGVMYSGKMKVWEHPVLEYPGRSEDISKVIYKDQLYRYDELRELEPDADYNKVYPVLNLKIAEELNLPPKRWSRVNKLKRHTRYIQKFYKEWIGSENFSMQFKPSQDGFIKLNDTEIHRIHPEVSKLRFGNQQTHYDPMQGLKKFGPYQLPVASHLDLFIIVADSDSKKAGNTLFTALRDGEGAFPGLSRFAGFPINTSEHNITFKNLKDPLPEIKQQLSRMEFDPVKNFGAIYISPHEENDPDPKIHRIYYRLKELLLKHRISSQVISRSSVFDPSFGYFLPNIATALIAKLGGVPWTLNQQERTELIIGIGAYRPKDLDKTYLGSAFCFLNDGTFKGFDSFTKNNMLKLAGSFQKAIRKFREEHPEVERVVLHFYKRISKEEAMVLRKALQEMRLDIPMVIVTIYKTGSKDLVIADMKTSHRLPISGTWFRSGRNQVLLCNNTRIPQSSVKISSYPFPLKLYLDVVDSGEEQVSFNRLLNDHDWVEKLLIQVYQFSRLNWQTVSIKHIPVSIAYPEMVARRFPYFEGNKIPDFGKENFWFL